MALSIKNPEAENLARELARQTGKSITQAVTEALRAAIQRLSGRRMVPSVREAILEISRRCSELPDLDERSADEILDYDERGGFR
jgi:antitoxin VapB